MKKLSGIDLRSNSSVVVVSDEAAPILYERGLPKGALRIRAALMTYREKLRGLGIEATYNNGLVNALTEDWYREHLANPTAIRQYEGLRYSGHFTGVTSGDIPKGKELESKFKMSARPVVLPVQQDEIVETVRHASTRPNLLRNISRLARGPPQFRALALDT
ncbi:hypothetical protein VSR68_40470 [Paraburkholderia phymatum]|uniref:hypothetical protein n=1 Tax=Paraburkholderia phymatum TaxID=148447 RepID=UPI00317E1C37